MSRIFIPVESVTIAHVARPLQIAKILRSRGVDVVFGINERFRWILEEEGFEIRPIYCAEPSTLLKAVRKIDFKKQNAALPAYFRSDLVAIRGAQPVDAILADFRFTIRLAAEYLGIPHIALTNGYYTPYYDVLPELPHAIAGWWPEALRRNVAIRRWARKVVPRLHARPYQKLCKKYFLKTDIQTGFDIALSKSLTLLCDLPEFTPQRDLPPQYHFVGPILWEPSEHLYPIPEEFDGRRRPLIYMTLGTSGEARTLDYLLRIFEKGPYDVIVSTGSKEHVKVTDRIYAVPFIKASEALERASLMICHGGNGSVYQALAHGVPLLCVTTFYDQEWNGQRVRDLGLGEAVFHTQLKRVRFLKLLERLIGDSKIKLNLKRFQLQMAEWNGAERAAEKILEFLETARVSRANLLKRRL